MIMITIITVANYQGRGQRPLITIDDHDNHNMSRDGDRGSSGYRSRDGDGDSLPDSDHWATSTDNNWTDYDQEVCV